MALRQTIGKPNLFRLKYRNEIRITVAKIVSDPIPPDKAGNLIDDKAQTLPESDRVTFIETINTELLSLHDGNFVRYWIRPSEFEKWKCIWDRH